MEEPGTHTGHTTRNESRPDHCWSGREAPARGNPAIYSAQAGTTASGTGSDACILSATVLCARAAIKTASAMAIMAHLIECRSQSRSPALRANMVSISGFRVSSWLPYGPAAPPVSASFCNLGQPPGRKGCPYLPWLTREPRPTADRNGIVFTRSRYRFYTQPVSFSHEASIVFTRSHDGARRHEERIPACQHMTTAWFGILRNVPNLAFAVC